MKMSQGNSLCDCLEQSKPFSFFSFIKSENGRVEKVLIGGGTSGRRDDVGYRRVSTV
jgi:hypothetical protein